MEGGVKEQVKEKISKYVIILVFLELGLFGTFFTKYAFFIIFFQGNQKFYTFFLLESGIFFIVYNVIFFRFEYLWKWTCSFWLEGKMFIWKQF